MLDPNVERKLRRGRVAQRSDITILDCEVEGKIPPELNGAFVRVGGEWFYPPRFADDAPLHADGYISAFRFNNGRASFQGKFVRTPRFEANLAAGRQLFGYYRNRLTDDPSVRHLDGTVANTAPVFHGGKLFALKEDALPYQIDPHTLETIGPWDFGGKYRSKTFTAHPKIDPLTGEMIAYGYEATGPTSDDVFLYTIDREGNVTREVRFKVPYVSVMHDIALTQKHVIFPFAGYVTSAQRLVEGKIHWGWDRTLPSYIGIIPRDGDAKDLRWFKGPERCMMHTFNARTVGDKVILDAPFWDSNFFPFFPNVDGSPFDPQRARSFIRRLTFDLASDKDTWEEEILFPSPISDLGKIDERFLSLEQRYVFVSLHDSSRRFALADLADPGERVKNTYGRFDLRDRTMDRFFVGETHHLQECCFVPRSADAREGEGWLLGVASNFLELRSELVVLDAEHLEEGALARVVLPFFAGPQVHGTWVPGSALAAA